jgi:hypothetical protein
MSANPVRAGGDPARELLRHTLATLAYRGGKAIRAAPAGFGEFQAGVGTRTPVKILAHIGDLMDWALSIASVSRSGAIRIRYRGMMSVSGSSQLWRLSRNSSCRTSRCRLPRKSCFKGPSPMR